jgi:diphthine synthase
MGGKLLLVGIGVADEKGISLAGLERLKSCEKIFAESYTNLMPPNALSRLEKLAGKKIEALSREEVEGERKLLESAAAVPTALVVAGDPMIATTHISLLLAAKKQGIKTGIIHASSILSAAMGESGLQAYKFGKLVTLAYWRKNYKPMAAYDVVSENLARNLHTLLLLDIDEKLGPMLPSVAGETLLKMEEQGKKKIFAANSMLVLLKGLGWGEPVIKYCALSELGKFDARSGPAVLIVPAKLHFLEEEFLLSL